jgi:hypothetical protein
MGTTPRCGTKDDLYFLSTGKTPHSVVGDKLGLKSKVSKMLLDLPTNKGAKETQTLSFACINLDDFLYITWRVSYMQVKVKS